MLQACFFAISGVLDAELAITRIKEAIAKTYGRRGSAVVEANLRVVDEAIHGLALIDVPSQPTTVGDLAPLVPLNASAFVKKVTATLMAGLGDGLPVSALPVDGTWPSGTAAYEKRKISEDVAMWDSDLCIQCGNCSIVCPHSVIRSKYYEQSMLADAPEHFRSAPSPRGLPDNQYTLQVYVDDCTGCGLCVEACPAVAADEPSRKAINLGSLAAIGKAERENIEFFESLPVANRSRVDSARYAEHSSCSRCSKFSGACAGCGETPYLKLLSQLFGDRAVIANATGCSSIYGGSLPTTPWTTDAAGRGPAWANSLFEDNAEFGLGMRLAADRHLELATRRLTEMREELGAELVDEILQHRSDQNRRSIASASASRL